MKLINVLYLKLFLFWRILNVENNMCVCFVTAVNLGTLELSLLYNPKTAALTCSLHRAKVGESHKKYIL
jgi:hypothetical protein